ncbi:protein BCAP [Xenopus laevis]|uniref:Protein BCAP n=1 Tax=Xenopus laevis TaxID=8355 RepID=ODF2L_XENLA|nr:protein BCAP [Xenopus laevis]Q08B20.1 RecName: Full=Protein BCAP; AltName: Full=Basal body centriole-associated protein; AltName: Full=Outer dense fiber protein 2-like [Xenopus laevis]AAI24910.1 Odf2l protein [Xenopus laevis]
MKTPTSTIQTNAATATHGNLVSTSNANFSEHMDERSSVLTQDTQEFLTDLLNRQKTRLNELSSHLSSMAHSETFLSSLKSSMHWPVEELTCDKVVTLLTKLKDTDVAANSVETLIEKLKDSSRGILRADNVSSLDAIDISKQNDLLWKELETFRHIRGILESFLQTHYSKSSRLINQESVEVLMGQLLEHEKDNLRLREQVVEKETKVEDLLHLIQQEKDTAVKSNQVSRSTEATHIRLQNLVKRKETENQQIVTQIQSLAAVISGRKLEIEDLRREITHLKEKQTFEKEGLKKAFRVQKQKVDNFQDVMENLNTQIKKKETELSEVHSSCSIWKDHHDSAVETKTRLEVQHESLTKQISDHLKLIKTMDEEREQSKEENAEKISAIILENAHFSEENVKLKASIAALESETVLVNSELLEVREKASQQKHFAEQYENQVQKLQEELNKLKEKFKDVLTKKKEILENKASENKKVDTNDYFLGNESFKLENNRIERKCEEIRIKLEKMIMHNEQLESKLKGQERDLQRSEVELEGKAKECSTLMRLLENAVEAGNKQISEENNKVLSKELALQRKLQSLESELKRKRAEHKQLGCTLNAFEKTHNLRLEEIRHSLEMTESRNKSIQSYVQFLKTSYAAMFE